MNPQPQAPRITPKVYFAIRPATPADNVVPLTGTAAGTVDSKPGSIPGSGSNAFDERFAAFASTCDLQTAK